MNIHHLELQNNKNAQWQMKSDIFFMAHEMKSHSFYCLLCVLFGLRSQKNLRRKSTKRTGGQLGIIWFGFEPFSTNTGIKTTFSLLPPVAPQTAWRFLDPRYQLVHPSRSVQAPWVCKERTLVLNLQLQNEPFRCCLQLANIDW